MALLGLDWSKLKRFMAFKGMDAPALTTATVVADATSDRWKSIKQLLRPPWRWMSSLCGLTVSHQTRT